jgi:hypothetical protein
LALSLAAGLALPLSLPTVALALTDSQRAMLTAARDNPSLDMQAAIWTVLSQELAAQERPLDEVVDDLAAAVLELGMNDEAKAEYAVALVEAAGDWGVANDAAEAVLVQAQASPTSVAAILGEAGDQASTSTPSGRESGALAAFNAAALTSTSIDLATAEAVFSKSAEIGQQNSGGDLAGGGLAGGGLAGGNNGATTGTQYSSVSSIGSGPVGGGFSTFSPVSTGGGGGGEQTGSGQSASPN